MSNVEPSLRRRVFATIALISGVAVIALVVALSVVAFPRATVGIALAGAGLASLWSAVVRRGAVHVARLVVGVVLLVVFVVLLIADRPLLVVGLLFACAVSIAAATYVFRIHANLPRAPRPRRPVVIWNPRSGGGKAARAHLEQEARARGIEPLELSHGADLERLAHDALDRGADAIAIAGGDGSQAIVARIAAERGVPFACIPAGTRNHFALDLGVDRDDVIGALDALVDGSERRIDLGDVNGRTFVNNVSIGVYGEAVQRSGYRDAKLRTFFETVPEVLGAESRDRVHWRDPAGRQHSGAAAFVISNNRYRFTGTFGDPSRPRLDAGVLGIVVLAAPGEEPGLRAWTTQTFRLDAPGPVHAGIDGEAVALEPPLRFRIRPMALACRIARGHPGASPAAMLPLGVAAAIRTLVRIAFGRRQHVASTPQPA
ncbi:MAG: diacylglycerol kinase family protein [Kofleriaceae bacterium]|nr:diacylglycerol kinase family protein [Kofleriaceae bacterium]